jgi:hypothetical protein
VNSRPGIVESSLLAALAAFTAAVAAASLWWPFGWDAGIFTWIANVIRHGGLPYRDAWDAKGPFTYYVYAHLQALAGPAMWPVRVFDLALMASSAFAVAVAVRRYAPGTTAAWIALLLLLTYYASDFANTAQPDAWIGALAAIAMAVLLRPDLDERLGLASLAAVVMGLGLVQKPTFLALLPLPALAVLLLPGRTLARRAVVATLLTLAALLPAVLTVAWFAAEGELARLVEGYVTLNVEMSRQVVGGVGRGLFYTLDFALRMPAAALLLPAAAVGAVHLWPRDRRACLLLLAWGAGMALGIAAQRRYWPYHWHPFAWSLGPLAGIGLAAVFADGDARARPGRVLATTVLALTLFTLVFPLQRRVREWVQLLRGDFPTRAAYLQQFPRDQTDLLDDDFALGEWLGAHSAPEDRVFVWDSPLANALARRRTPGRIGFFVPLVLARANQNEPVPLGPIQQALRAEFLASLATPETRYVVVSHKAMAGIEPNLRKNVPVLFPEFSAALAERWQVTDSVGDYRIHTRRPAGP